MNVLLWILIFLFILLLILFLIVIFISILLLFLSFCCTIAYGDLEVDVQPAADALDIAAGAWNHGIDVGGDVVDHEPHLRIDVPIDADGEVLLTSCASAPRCWRQSWVTAYEVQVGIASDELHRSMAPTPLAVVAVQERVFLGKRSRPGSRFLVVASRITGRQEKTAMGSPLSSIDTNTTSASVTLTTWSGSLRRRAQTRT